jgi:hypothetical protein
VSKQTNRQFYIHAPTTFDSEIAPARGMHWNASLPPECNISGAIDAVDKPHTKFYAAAHGKAPCVAVRINQDEHDDQKKKEALSELFAPLRRPKRNYAALHLRTGGNCAYAGIDPGRDTMDDGIDMLGRLIKLKLEIHIVSDCLLYKTRLASQCTRWQATCFYRAGTSRHIDRQKTTRAELSTVWDDFRVLARASKLEHSRSGFSAVAAMWPLAADSNS